MFSTGTECTASEVFFQYQCVLIKDAEDATEALLQTIRQSQQRVSLAVMETFAKRAPAGYLSFAQQGVTLALDFPNRGMATLNLLDQLDKIVLTSQGRIYPAKDARMSAAHFQQCYPNWEKFCTYIDPLHSSNFWRRVTANKHSL